MTRTPCRRFIILFLQSTTYFSIQIAASEGETSLCFPSVCYWKDVVFIVMYKNKINHPISSNSHPSAIANVEIHCLKWEWFIKLTETSYNFDKSQKSIRRLFRKISPQQGTINVALPQMRVGYKTNGDIMKFWQKSKKHPMAISENKSSAGEDYSSPYTIFPGINWSGMYMETIKQPMSPLSSQRWQEHARQQYPLDFSMQ